VIRSGYFNFLSAVCSATKLSLKNEAMAVLRSIREMNDFVGHGPQGFGNDPAVYRYDVIFLKEPLADLPEHDHPQNVIFITCANDVLTIRYCKL
jgi:hypothetical protein